MTTVHELLADLIGAPAAAKTANSANREHSCGQPVDSASANGLRIAANPPTPDLGSEPHSQVFAGDSQAIDQPQGEQWCVDSQDSQDSQGCPSQKQTRTCADCCRRLPRGTCGTPVEAGLIPAAEGFGIVWAEPEHAKSCPAFIGKSPTSATQDRPYTLTVAECDAAHSESWGDVVIGRFLTRQDRLQRLGFSVVDAEDIAERLHLRDVHEDHRVLCVECRHLLGTTDTGWHCGNHLAADVGRALPADLATTLQVCAGFNEERGMK